MTVMGLGALQERDWQRKGEGTVFCHFIILHT